MASSPWKRGSSLKTPRIKLILFIALMTAMTILGVRINQRAVLSSPAPVTTLLDRHGRFLAEISGVAPGDPVFREPQVPPRVATAVICIEDRRFRHHPGVDPVAITRAVWQNVTNQRRISGASTLAMQVVRLQCPAPRTYSSKAMEAVTALVLTARYGRDTILNHYLSLACYSNGITGIAHAAGRYFNKPLEDLSWAEIAFLTAIPQSPSRMNPYRPAGRSRAIQRSRRILTLLLKRNAIDPDEYELALNQLYHLKIPPRATRPAYAMHAILKLEKILETGVPPGTGNNRIRTTLDLEIQKEVEHLTWAAVNRWETRGAGNAAVIVADARTREIIAWVGSTDYFNPRTAGSMDFTGVPRSSGSTLKPFLYALALDRGIITPGTVLHDSFRGAGEIGNADGRFLGPMLPRMALANSRNVPAVNLLADIGIDRAHQLFRDLGLHDGTGSARYYGLGMAIGGLPVTLENLVAAYSTFTCKGIPGALKWFPGGETHTAKPVFQADTARIISLFLSDPMARLPSFPRMGACEYEYPVAVKTGTSSNCRNAWTVAYSPKYIVGAWVGHPDFRVMQGLTGYRSAARLVHEIMNTLQSDMSAAKQTGFPPPETWSPAPVSPVTGQRVNTGSRSRIMEWFPPGTEPVDIAGPGQFTTIPVDRITTVTRIPDPRIVYPENNLTVVMDPETPADLNTLLMAADTGSDAMDIVWEVDGLPFAVSEPPHRVRWPMQTGRHVFHVRIPETNQVSELVEVMVL